MSGADLGGGGGGGYVADTPTPQGFDPLPTQRVPPFDTFSEIHFWPTDPKIFLKAPLAPIHTNFKGERAPKKNAIFCQIFSKNAQKRLFLTVFPKICLRRGNLSQNRGKTVLWESSKNQFSRPKKKGRQNFGKFFENPPPPLEKILDPPMVWVLQKLALSSQILNYYLWVPFKQL